MPVHAFTQPRGEIVSLTIDSAAVRDNLLGDPAARTVAVYLPPGYRTSDARYPMFVDLASFSNSGLRRLAWTGFGESMPQRLDRLVARKCSERGASLIPETLRRLSLQHVSLETQ